MTKAFNLSELEDLCYRGRLYRVTICGANYYAVASDHMTALAQAAQSFPARGLCGLFRAFKSSVTRVLPGEFRAEFEGITLAVRVAVA